MERKSRNIHRLTRTKVRSITEPGLHADGGNLYLLVGPGGGKSWVFRYSHRHRQHDMGLGSVAAFDLDEARELAKQQRQLLAKGVDPLSLRRQEKQRQLALRTFQDVAAEFIAIKAVEWRNAKHRLQWKTTLSQYVYPRIGATPVTDLDTDAIVGCIGPIWLNKPTTAQRVLGRVARVLDPKGANPARWTGHIEYLLPAQAGGVKHHEALPYAELPEFMVKLRARRGRTEKSQLVALAVEWAILTATRSGETRGITIDEVDYDRRLWTIPASRMKANREHIVPLNDRLMEIWADICFGGPRSTGDKVLFGLSDTAMLKLVRTITGRRVTLHGFRSSFRDWAAETGVRRELAEAALAHAVGSQVEAAYNRTKLVEQRREVMEAWAAFVYHQ